MSAIRVKEIKYKGKSEEELAAMSLSEFAKLANTRVRRSITRGFSDVQKKLLLKIEDLKSGKRKKSIKTHCRDIPVVPQMLGTTIEVYDGKSYHAIEITIEKLGHYLGEFSMTRKKVSHKAPGVGATRSSKFQSVK